jgi:hypothetical protein
MNTTGFAPGDMRVERRGNMAQINVGTHSGTTSGTVEQDRRTSRALDDVEGSVSLARATRFAGPLFDAGGAGIATSVPFASP